MASKKCTIVSEPVIPCKQGTKEYKCTFKRDSTGNTWSCSWKSGGLTQTYTTRATERLNPSNIDGLSEDIACRMIGTGKVIGKLDQNFTGNPSKETKLCQ